MSRSDLERVSSLAVDPAFVQKESCKNKLKFVQVLKSSDTGVLPCLIRYSYASNSNSHPALPSSDFSTILVSVLKAFFFLFYLYLENISTDVRI